MLGAVIGGIFVLAGIAVAVLSLFAAGMDPAGRPMSKTIGYWPFGLALGLLLLGLGVMS